MKKTINTVTMSFSLPKPIAAKVKQFVRRQKRSGSAVAAEAFQQYLVLWGGIDMPEKPAKVPKDQEWARTPEWQEHIRQGFEDLKAGRAHGPYTTPAELKKALGSFRRV